MDALQYGEPPTVSKQYSPELALADLPAIKYAAALFLNSSMIDSENYCLSVDPRKERLYITSGYSLIQCLKALLSFEQNDLRVANEHVQHGHQIAVKHRAPAPPILSRVAGFVWDNATSGVSLLRIMTPAQRHAELLFAETTFAKALLGVICSGNWLSFLSEALSFRTMINKYLELGKFLECMDAEALARGEGPIDASIDNDFRSGVELGVGASNLILSFMPEKLLAVVEIFGYKGNRSVGLKKLMDIGGWSTPDSEPTISFAKGGLRRGLADICLLCFHLVISTITFRGVDIAMAQTILEWNLKHYPNGVFFLLAQGKLRVIRSQATLAIESYEAAVKAQSQYRSLHYVSFWELAISNMAVWRLDESLKYWEYLQAEATWSKACYSYGVAVCLLQLGGDQYAKKAGDLMKEIPSLVHKIAGKSIPLEKFVSRKARKFQQQKGRLILPALEFSYVLLGMDHAPPTVIEHTLLPSVNEALADVEANKARRGFWDDICLARLLEGVCYRFLAYPDEHAEKDNIGIGARKPSLASRAEAAFLKVIEDGQHLELDHYILYNAYYELGRLLVAMGRVAEGRKHLECVVSGKRLEKSASTRKGKYSLESTLVLHATAALEALGN
ncbi:hypothetical protein SCHPADRAFT_993336 [Schizopora paradoxa]|uniref:Tetratricopeptide repeat protein 39B n=1 Tax=Schizopora paradoxa TaxID=27342 RepID=A0A0H2S3P6_9AGAM|nr:hypothetical protein SCHPADRAFT_993336 [Schizopora paradoxa]